MFAAPAGEWNTVVVAPLGVIPPTVDDDTFVAVQGTIMGKCDRKNSFGGTVNAVTIYATAAGSNRHATYGRCTNVVKLPEPPRSCGRCTLTHRGGRTLRCDGCSLGGGHRWRKGGGARWGLDGPYRLALPAPSLCWGYSRFRPRLAQIRRVSSWRQGDQRMGPPGRRPMPALPVLCRTHPQWLRALWCRVSNRHHSGRSACRARCPLSRMATCPLAMMAVW